MAASVNDKFRESTSGTRPEPANLTAQKTIGASSITLNTTTGWPTDTGVDFIIYRTDVNGNYIQGTQTDWVGVVSGTSINNLTLKAGTDQVYDAGSQSVVIAAVTAAWGDSLVEGILEEHAQDGSHSDITADSITIKSGGSVDFSNAPLSTTDYQDGSVTADKLSTTAITIGYAQITSDFNTSSGTPVQVTGLSAPVTIPSGGRMVEIEVFGANAYQSSSGGAFEVSIWDGTVGSGTQLNKSRLNNASLGNSVVICKAKLTPSAGSKTYNVGFKSGAGAATLEAGVTYPASISVKVI